MIRYASVCSGIEAPSVAWHPLGWQPVFFSEIDAFPRAVLAHHYPDTPNYGNMINYKDWPDANIDLLVGGTPCQSFSVAGLRKGLDDPRGNLMLTYLAIAGRYRPRWLVWENVPGVLSSNAGKDFGAFICALEKCGYGFAYRILDAQYFGTPQRRRRVFVVGHLGDWRRAAAVLFERHSMQGHPSPRRETGKDITGTLTSRSKSGGGTGDDFECSGGLIANIAKPLSTSNQRNDHETETLISFSQNQSGEIFTNNTIGTLNQNSSASNRNTPMIAFDTTQITSPKNHSNPQPGDACHPLAAHQHAPAIAFDCKASGQSGFGIGEISPTLKSIGGSHIAAYQCSGSSVGECGTLKAKAKANSDIPFANHGRGVRRLTPRECERLQGFPDDYTAITYRGKPAADRPRYRAIGNSMAVPVMRWIGERIAAVERIKS